MRSGRQGSTSTALASYRQTTSSITPLLREALTSYYRTPASRGMMCTRGHTIAAGMFKALPETPKLPLPQMPVKGKLADMRNSPTHAILDLGCTRAMGSRPAITAFMSAATKRGLVCEVLPTQGKFNFANSQTTTCTEKMRVWFPTQPPVSTDFDIVEEGNVPLLMSLIQMRNLRFSLQLTPESCTLESPALGAKFEVEQSTARRLVLDRCWIQLDSRQ